MVPLPFKSAEVMTTPKSEGADWLSVSVASDREIVPTSALDPVSVQCVPGVSESVSKLR